MSEAELSETIVAMLPPYARSLGIAVERIEHGPQGVRVTTTSGSFEAAEVVVAVPPVMASRIAFEPPLPAGLSRALSVWESGDVIKVLVRYPKAFWREAGLSGTVMWRDQHGLFACEVSPDPDHAALVVFMGGPRALSWRALNEADFRETLLAKLAAALGRAALSAPELIGQVEKVARTGSLPVSLNPQTIEQLGQRRSSHVRSDPQLLPAALIVAGAILAGTEPLLGLVSGSLAVGLLVFGRVRKS